MNPRYVAALAVLASLTTATNALADCPVYAEMQETKAAFHKAVAAEKAGRLKEALALYVRAGERGAWCSGEADGDNVNVMAAAQRAAAIALPLAKAAEQKGNLREALDLYEQGAYLGPADRVRLAIARANADDVGVVEHALDVARKRESYASSIPAGIAAAGPYKQDAALVAELKSMPMKGAERALTREATAFNEQYLNDFVQLVQARPEPKGDIQSLMQNAASAASVDAPERVFLQKWPNDLLEQSRAALAKADEWARIGSATGAYHDAAVRTTIETCTRERARQRAATLARVYNGAPELLEAAKAYYKLGYAREGAHSDADAARADAERERAIDQVNAQASTLGDGAERRGRFTLAIGYYGVAGADAKKRAVEERQRQTMLTQAEPDIAAARALAATLSDPAVVAAMKQQAQAARAAAAAAQKQKPSDKDSAKSASDLERELGLR